MKAGLHHEVPPTPGAMYEREKALRAQQDENAIDRVAEGARNIGGGANIGGSSSS